MLHLAGLFRRHAIPAAVLVLVLLPQALGQQTPPHRLRLSRRRPAEHILRGPGRRPIPGRRRRCSLLRPRRPGHGDRTHQADVAEGFHLAARQAQGIAGQTSGRTQEQFTDGHSTRVDGRRRKRPSPNSARRSPLSSPGTCWSQPLPRQSGFRSRSPRTPSPACAT